MIALAIPAAARLARTPRAWVPALAWLMLGIAMGVAARSRGAPHGADHALVEAVGSVIVPLFAYTWVAGALGGRSLRDSVAGVVSFGAPPARAAVATCLVLVAVTTLLAAGLGAGVASIAHGVDDPPVVRDAFASAYACALGAAAYVSLFALGGTLGRRGGGRAVLLVLDFALGSGSGWLSVPTPRAHLRNLLGGLPPLGLNERASAAGIAALAFAFLAVAAWRCRR